MKRPPVWWSFHVYISTLIYVKIMKYMSKPFKIFLKTLLIIFGVIVLLLGIYTLLAYISWSSQTEFNVEGRLGNMDVPNDTLKIMCLKGELDIKKPAPIEQLNILLPQIVETCGNNANAMLLFGTEKKAYDILVRSSSKFAPERLLILQQDLIPSDKSTEMTLAVYDESSYAKIYEKNLGTVPSFLREGEWGIVFKDFDEDGKMDARTRIEFPATVGYLTLYYQNGKFSVWKHPARNESFGYVYRDDVLYCEDKANPDVDLDTFVILNSSWAKDKNHVYEYQCEINDFFDPATFVSLDDNGDFVKDKNGVWFEGYLGYAGLTGHNQVEGADSETYVYMGDGIGKDKYRVYNYIYEDEEYPGVDVATLVGTVDPEQGGLWMKDKNQVYWRGKVVNGASPTTFEVMADEWGRDGNKLYYTYKYIPTGDPDTLQDIDSEISGAYQKDKNNIYYTESGFDDPILESVDYATFRPISSQYAKDKSYVYYYGRTIIEGADPETFVDLNDYGYAKDKNHVYINDHIVEGEDPATFSIEDR